MRGLKQGQKTGAKKRVSKICSACRNNFYGGSNAKYCVDCKQI